MNKQKKLELLSNALVAEMKTLLVYHFSSEEAKVMLKLLVQNLEDEMINYFIQKVKHLYKQVDFWKLTHKTIKLYWY